MKRILPALVLTAIFLLCLAIVFAPTLARADEQQDFIHRFHKDCCPHNRCFPVKAAPSLHFWDVEGYRSYIPLGQERRWHFKETYGCAYENAPLQIRCLFMPAPEAS